LKDVKRLLAAEAPVEDGERLAVRRDGAAVLSAENERKVLAEGRGGLSGWFLVFGEGG
jgi:hypothetical protein